MAVSVIREELFNRALTLFQQAAYQEALDIYRQLLEVSPEDGDSLILMGCAYYELGQFKEAVCTLQQATVFKPQVAEAWSQLGLAYEGMRKTRLALAAYEKACQLHLTLDHVINFGALLQRLGRYQEALDFYHQSLETVGFDIDLGTNLGLAYHQAGRSQEGIQYLQTMLSSRPTHIPTLMNLATILHQTEKLVEARAIYESILVLDPIHLPAMMNLANVCFVLGELDVTRFYIEQAMAIESDSLDIAMRRGELYEFTETQAQMAAGTLFCNMSQKPPLSNASWNIILFSNCGVSVMGGGQQPPQLARAFYQMGHRTLFAQVYSPLVSRDTFPVVVEPFLSQRYGKSKFQEEHWQKMIAAFNKEALNENNLVVFTAFSPYLTSLVPVFKAHGYRVAYCCIDDTEGFQALQAYADPLYQPQLEWDMIEAVDVCFATSRPLVEKIQGKTGKPCTWLPNGFSPEQFPYLRNDVPIAPPLDLVRGETKTFLYWGNILSPWMNYDLLAEVAIRHPDWAFNMIGPTWPDPQFLQLDNVHYLGVKRVDELYPYGRSVDIAFLHFAENMLTWAVNPVKVYEYLACGLPVISTPMADMSTFPNTWVVQTVAEFEAAVAEIQAIGEDKDRLAKTHEAVQQFLPHATWQSRAKTMLDSL